MLKFVTVALAVGMALASDGPRPDQRGIQWTGGTFDWPCETTKSMYKSGGRYIGKNVIATRSVIYKDDAFVALPR